MSSKKISSKPRPSKKYGGVSMPPGGESVVPRKLVKAYEEHMRTAKSETISVSQADIYRLAAEALLDHRTVIAALSGSKVYDHTRQRIQKAAKALGIGIRL